jgi:DNA repair ATPase RecN
VSPKLRIELWGWGEIESATRSVEQQGDLLDRFTPQSGQAREKIHGATRALESNTRDIVATVRSIQDVLPKVELLDEKEAELAALDTPGMQEICREFDAVEQSAAALETLSPAIAETRGDFLDEQQEPYDIKAEIVSQMQEMRDLLEASGEVPALIPRIACPNLS